MNHGKCLRTLVLLGATRNPRLRPDEFVWSSRAGNRHRDDRHRQNAPHRFVDEHVFLTKHNQLGVVLRVEDIDYECLREETLETYTRRAAAA